MKLIDVKTISEILGVKPSTLYQWAEIGQIPCIKLNGSLRFDLDDIEAWVASCKKESVNGYNPLSKLEAHQKGGRN